VGVFLDELAATALRAREVALASIDIRKLDGLTEKIAFVGFFERE
jgi:hypothetical protein